LRLSATRFQKPSGTVNSAGRAGRDLQRPLLGTSETKELRSSDWSPLRRYSSNPRSSGERSLVGMRPPSAV